jgi:two-component system, NarL family, response regulator LiaR
MGTKIRILIADDHFVVREGLGTTIAAQKDMELVGRAANGIEAVSLAQTVCPDVILMDLVMPQMDGLEAIRRIKQDKPDARILVLTGYTGDGKIYPAIKAGALGYLLKDATHDQLLQAIRDVAQGRVSLHPAIASKMMREIEQPSSLPPTSEPLSARELDVLRLIARGLSNEEIATTLGINDRTVGRHVTSILTKLHLANRTQAALHALRQGIADLE